MDTIVLLITLSAGALAVHYKERLRRLVPERFVAGRVVAGRFVTGGHEGPKVLVDKTFGLARLELPEGWRAARDLNETASIEAVHPPLGRHVIVISDAVEDFVPEMTMFEHSENTRLELTSSITLIACSGPERRTVGGFESLQYEIEGFFQQTRVKYLHTTVAGNRAFHQVLAWATCSRYDRTVFEGLLNGFTELPDFRTAAREAPAQTPLHITPASSYDVH